jgi:hypothetical protein
MGRDKEEESAVRATTVTVKPLSVNGNDVECDILGPDVTDDAIFLQQNQDYDITIKLVPGPAGSYKFHQTKPFCNRNAKCPPALPGGNALPPFSAQRVSDTELLISAAKVNGRAVAHYRLNFDNGQTCDPVIIHE